VIRSAFSRSAARAKFSEWRKNRGNQAGSLAASKALLEGATEDPWGSVSKAIVAFYQGRGQEQRRSEQEAKLLEERDYDRSRQAQADARAQEQFELTKKVSETQLAEAEASRERAEQARQYLEKYLPTLSPEDQALLAPYVGDLDKFHAVYGDLQDNRRQQSQFDATFGETQRRNKVDERNDSVRIGLEKRRIDLAEEGSKLKGEKENTKKLGNFLITYDAAGKEVRREVLPENLKERRNAAMRIMENQATDPKQAAVILQEIDAELTSRLPADRAGEAGFSPVTTHRQAVPAENSDDAWLKEINAAKNEGLSDAEILGAIEDPVVKARVSALLRRR
jgi:hypothetical protein